MKLRLTLIRCGTCGRAYGNPLTHTCVTRIGRRPGRTRAKLRVTAKCGTCGRRVANPLTHTCRKRSDFRKRQAAERKRLAAERRKAAAARRRAERAAAGKPKHDYRACRDADCARVGCVAYRDGVADGLELAGAAR